MEYHNTFIFTKTKLMFTIKNLDEEIVLQTTSRAIFLLTVRHIARENGDNPDEIEDHDSTSDIQEEFSIHNVENAKKYINLFTNDMYLSK